MMEAVVLVPERVGGWRQKQHARLSRHRSRPGSAVLEGISGSSARAGGGSRGPHIPVEKKGESAHLPIGRPLAFQHMPPMPLLTPPCGGPPPVAPDLGEHHLPYLHSWGCGFHSHPFLFLGIRKISGDGQGWQAEDHQPRVMASWNLVRTKPVEFTATRCGAGH